MSNLTEKMKRLTNILHIYQKKKSNNATKGRFLLFLESSDITNMIV